MTGRPTAASAAGGLIVMAILVCAALTAVPAPASAQDREMRAMRERIEDLESQLRSITRYLSKNEDAPRDYQPAGSAGGDGVTVDQMANMEVRLGALENQIRNLTGQLEETQYQIRQLNDRVDTLSAGPAGGAPSFGGTANRPAGGDGGFGAVSPNAGQPGQGGVQSGDLEPGEPEPLPTGEPTELYNAALAKLRQDDFQAAARSFQDFVAQFPDDELTPNAQYWLGEAYYAQQNYGEAARAFLTAYTKYPESSKASGALLKLGISLGELDQKDDACAALREFTQKYPNASPIEMNRAKVARQDLSCS